MWRQELEGEKRSQDLISIKDKQDRNRDSCPIAIIWYR